MLLALGKLLEAIYSYLVVTTWMMGRKSFACYKHTGGKRILLLLIFFLSIFLVSVM